jgi:hypothetical protein
MQRLQAIRILAAVAQAALTGPMRFQNAEMEARVKGSVVGGLVHGGGWCGRATGPRAMDFPRFGRHSGLVFVDVV